MGEAVLNSHIKYFFKGTSAIFAGKALGEGLNYIGFIAVARWFGIDIAGVFFLGLSILNVVSTTTRFGMDGSIVKYTAEYFCRGAHKRISILLSIAILFVGIFSILILGGWLGAQNWLASQFSSTDKYWMISVMLVAMPFFSLATVLISATRGAKKINYHVALTFVFFPAVFLFFLFLTKDTTWRGFAPFVSYGLATVLFCGAAVWAVRRVYRFRLILPVLGTSLQKKLLVYSYPLWISSLLGILYLRTDLFFVSHFFDDYSLGVYSSGIKTAAFISIFLATSNVVVAPLFSELNFRNNFGDMGMIFRIMCKWISLMGMLAMAGYLLFMNQILQLFDVQGTEVQAVFILLGFSQLLNAVTGPVGTLLMMTGNQRFLMYNDLIFYSVHLISLSVFIRWLGIPGAAVSTVIIILLMNISRSVKVYRQYSIHIFNRQNIALLAFGTMLLSLLMWLRCGPFGYHIGWWPALGYLVVVVAGSGLFVYLFCLQQEDRQLMEELKRRLGV
jgi:O-antigen/teichoic acid export membrane protein